jgi:hypothetical protein
MPEHLLQHLLTMGELHRAGQYDRKTDGVVRVTRRSAITIDPQVQNAGAETTAQTTAASSGTSEATNGHPEGTPLYVTEVPAGYRDWKLISVAREEGDLDDIRAILGNDIAVNAYREGKLPLPEGSIIARLAWSYLPSEVNNKTFGRAQSFVPGDPKNGVQFMIKDSTKYASTGGWGYGHFDNGKPADNAFMQSCYPCHQAIKDRDYVFTRYSH